MEDPTTVSSSGDGKNKEKMKETTIDFTQEKTEDIQYFMRECGVSIPNIHLLEGKLLEKQNDLMSSNIEAFLQQQNELEKLGKSVDRTIEEVKKLHENVKKLMPSVDMMEQTIAHIKHRNEQLAVMDDNHHKLENALDALLKELNLEITTVRTLENPEFDTKSKYLDSLEAAKQLQRRIDLELQPPKLATIRAVQMRKEYFQTLKDKFCSNAGTFLQDAFANEVKKPDKSDERLKIAPHTMIHDSLRRYKDLVQYLRRLDKTRSNEVRASYETSYQTMYSKELKRFFHKLSDRLLSDSKLTRMNSLHPYVLEDFVKRNTDDEEKSEGSTMFALFRNVTTPAESKIIQLDTIEEDSSGKKLSVTKAFRVALKQVLPLVLSEIEFLREYFAVTNDPQETEKLVDQMSRAIFDGYLLNEFQALVEKANQMDNFNTLHMLIITDSAVHVFRHQSEFVASFLTNLQRQLAISWGQFVGRECKWITESTTAVKQAGVLPPIGKFPAFCNEMFKIKKMAEEQAVEITGEIRMVENDGKPEEIASGVVDRVVTINLSSQDAAEKKDGDDTLVFGEYEAITSTIHKMVATLFSWLEKKAAADPKYRDVCLMENYYFFAKIFEKADGLRALNEHVAKAKREYRTHCRDYVKWSVRYQCEGLVDFWDKVLSHTSENKKHSQQGDTTVGLSLYMALADVKKILQTHFGDTKLVKKTVDGLFKRMQKHLKHNELLQQSMWRKITDYFMKRFKKVKLELERAYRVNDLMPVKEEEVYDLFEKKNLEAFKFNFDETSSVGSSSIGASSVASSAITGITRTTTKTGNKFLGKDFNKEQGSHAHSSLGYGNSTHTRDSPSLSSKESGPAVHTPTNLTLR